ncbi:FHA domain-containing protein [Chitinimonas lacunae]|uniref:FHA domain-containing protein n=1 Tax=Chitinimonas lacunae TaxID=1963018 RepID=A0ABV8MSS3_9NEIS
MEAVIWVEELDHAGRVRLRHRVAGRRARIGRAYAADVLIDDAYVSPLHLEVELLEDGGLTLRDLGSANGSQLDGRPFEQVITASDCTVRIGESLLRLRSAAHTVPAAVLGRQRDWLGLLRGRWVPLLLVLATLGVIAGEQWLDRLDPTQLASELGQLLAIMGGLQLWALLWAGFSRLLLHRNEFGRHLAIGSLALLLWIAGNELLDLLEYAWLGGLFGFVLRLLLFAGLGFALLFAHLRLTSRVTDRRLATIVAIQVGFGLSCFLLLQYIDSDRFDSEPAYDSRIAPLPAGWLPADGIDEFFADSEALKQEADEAAKQP